MPQDLQVLVKELTEQLRGRVISRTIMEAVGADRLATLLIHFTDGSTLRVTATTSVTVELLN